MSTAPARYERMRCLFDFARTVFGSQETALGGARAAYRRQGVRPMSHSEFRGVADAEEGQARWCSNNFQFVPSRQPASVSCHTSPILITVFNPIVESTTGSTGRLM